MKNDGRFKKGERRSIATEFKKGQHWRPAQSFREKEWLEEHYVHRQKSCKDIAEEFGVTDAAIVFWLRKHDIPRRSVSEARAIKKWGSTGTANPMFGKRGAASPNWMGGATAERQAFYSSREWKRACSKVWKRDKAQCQRCSVKGADRKLHVHHIVSFAVKALRAEPSNLTLLCDKCHRWVHSKANTEKLFIKTI